MLPPKTPLGLGVALIDNGPDVTDEQLADWYEGEHIPRRLTVPGIMSAQRFKAIDSKTPKWLTLVDLEAPEIASSPAYLALASQGSDTEKLIFSKLGGTSVQIYAHTKTFVHPNTIPKNDLPTKYLLTVGFVPDSTEAGAELDKWYEEEHMELLAKNRGSLADQPEAKYFAVHWFDNKDFASTPEFQHASSTPWRLRILEHCTREARTWELTKDFGSA
uniref:EthD domain-containing protein n=1 Tax=Mycena chlorophos TaxID=658473 RepID=A0ABQ0L735_MYCCL|nr:predicted protein [Mycena chlorophos]